GDLGGEQAERGELFVFAQGLFALENARVETGVLQGDGREAGDGGEQAFLVVVVAVRVVGEGGEHAADLVLKEHGHGQHGAQVGIAGQIDDVDEFGRLDVEELDGAAGGKHRGDQAGLQGKIDAGGGAGGGGGEGFEARGLGARINQGGGGGAAAAHP